jgi:VCBS repeat-containing protein
MRRHTLLYGTLLFCLLLLGLTPASATRAQTTGAIAGKVTGDGNAPVADIYVVAYRQLMPDFWEYAAQAITDANGDYLISDLPPDTYRISFTDQSYPRNYFDEYYSGATSVLDADDVVVTAGATTSNINVQLSSGAHIKGVVTGPATEPLAGIEVAVSNNSYYKSTLTGSDGAYDIGGMEAGEYTVRFTDRSEPPTYAWETFDNQHEGGTATPITLLANQTRANINAQLERLGVIRGRVTNMTNTPLPNITIVGQRYDATDPGWYETNYASTDASGIYTLTGLYSDTYRVQFRDNHYGDYSFEWYDDTFDPETATLLPVAYNSVTNNIDAQLTGRGAISGTVTNEGGAPLANIFVQAEFLEDARFNRWASAGSTYTDANGRYTICCLNPQSYRILFNGHDQRYIPEYYEDILDPSTLELDVTLVAVVPTQTTPNINAKLAHYSAIDGTVTDENGQPIDQVAVEFYRVGNLSIDYASTANPDAQGYFNNNYLYPGRYRVYIYDYPGYYINEYYDNAPDLDSATDITVTKEATVTISAVLASKGRISGQVTDRDGQPLEGITTVLYYDGGGYWYNSRYGTTDANGNYIFGGLDAATYRIGFEDNRAEREYIAEYYDDVAAIDSATDIVVAEGAAVNNVDAQLTQLSAIQGQVTNENGDPLPGIGVSAQRYVDLGLEGGRWDSDGYRETDSSGQYRLTGLYAGLYRLRFEDYNGVYQSEWYDNRGYEATATTFTLTAETTLTGMNAQLATEPFSWPPYARPDAVTVVEGASTTSLTDSGNSVLNNDLSDSGNPLQATVATKPQHGTLTLNSDGSFTYAHDGSEAPQDHFTYRANDGVKPSDIATVTITIQPVNDLPVAVDDSAQIVRGGATSQLSGGATSVLANDSDPDHATLTAAVLTNPQHGTLTLNANGSFVYTHNGDGATSDSFTYRAVDGLGAADNATVTIAIAAEAALTLNKTVSIEGITPRCTSVSDMKVPVDTTIVYCYTVHNRGALPLTKHSLVDSHLGQLLTDVDYRLAPGAVYSTTFTQTLTVSTTNIATWTATSAAGNAVVMAPGSTTVKGAATVRISGPTDDADGDTIPDNVEKVGDIDRDNLPNFLDPDADGDDVPDRDEVGSNPNAPRDSDNDGIPDYLDATVQPPTDHRQLLPVIRH